MYFPLSSESRTARRLTKAARPAQAVTVSDPLRLAPGAFHHALHGWSSRLTEKLNIQTRNGPLRVICGRGSETCHRLLTLRLARREQSESARPGPAWLRLAARGISCVFKFSTCH